MNQNQDTKWRFVKGILRSLFSICNLFSLNVIFFEIDCLENIHRLHKIFNSFSINNFVVGNFDFRIFDVLSRSTPVWR